MENLGCFPCVHRILDRYPMRGDTRQYLCPVWRVRLKVTRVTRPETYGEVWIKTQKGNVELIYERKDSRIEELKY